jgi:hypothetical protein
LRPIARAIQQFAFGDQAYSPILGQVWVSAIPLAAANDNYVVSSHNVSSI